MKTTSRSLLTLASLASIAALGACNGHVLAFEENPAGATDQDGGAAAPPHASKIDLLFMIDNSASMADKQQLLAKVAPDIVNRFASPVCVDVDGIAVATQPPIPDACPDGAHRQFPAVDDIHIGIIDSSLGGHGADACSKALAASFSPTMEDMAHLIDRGSSGATYGGRHFLWWDPNAKQTPPGQASAPGLVSTFQEMVLGVGETGCGFESQLEAVYRFLVEPTPFESIQLDSNGLAQRSGTDTVLLDERAAFLRPDSLVAVILLTDEDDCSVQDGGQYYVGLQASMGQASFHPPRATGACQTNPSDPCCYSCGQSTPAGCPDKASDPECAKGDYDDYADPLNLRCFDQKRRFGIDFTYPVQRYVDGLSNPQVKDGDGNLVANPLFAGGRDPRLVLFTTVVGVPWQDLARDPSDLTKGYHTTSELAAAGGWGKILGDPANDVPPSDVHMVGSIAPRPGLPGPDAALHADPANGHEWAADLPSRGDDLQYACIMPIGQPRDCSTITSSCDCGDGDKTQNPLCQDPTTGAYGKVQYAAKAYPAPRILSVAKALGDQAVVASICGPGVVDAASPAYAYRPAIEALVSRATPALNR